MFVHQANMVKFIMYIFLLVFIQNSTENSHKYRDEGIYCDRKWLILQRGLNLVILRKVGGFD